MTPQTETVPLLVGFQPEKKCALRFCTITQDHKDSYHAEVKFEQRRIGTYLGYKTQHG